MSENDLPHPRQQLNNLLQSKDMVNDLQWDISGQGPAHNRVWYAICLVGGRKLGDGRGYKKRKAKDEAAQMAIGALSSNPTPGMSMVTIRRRKSFP